MQLAANALGPIDRLDLTLKPLTILLGPNRSGKTWLTHSCFKVMERLRYIDQRPGMAGEPAIDRLARDVAEKWIAPYAAEPVARMIFRASKAELVAELPEETVFNATPEDLVSATGGTQRRDASLSLTLRREELAGGPFQHLEVIVERDTRTITFWFRGEGEEGTRDRYDDLDHLRQLVAAAIKSFVMTCHRVVRALPAERLFLSQIYATVVATKGLVLPRALVDYCYMMSMGAATARLDSSPFDDALSSVAGGRFRFSEGHMLFEGTGFRLGLSSASSLTKSLAGLAVFLERALPGDVVFIDEPEMNAHPEAQVQLAELFALMVRRGLQVIAATHSPYFVDHLTSLIEGSQLSPAQRERLAPRFALRDPAAFLLPEDVAVYGISASQARPLFDERTRTLDWSGFSEVSRHEAELYDALLEAEAHSAAPVSAPKRVRKPKA